MNLTDKINFIQNLKSPLFDLLGCNFTEITKTKLTAQINVDSRLHQPFGILHGGISVTICESLASLGSYLNVDDDHAAVGIEINANHIRQVKTGIITAIAEPLNLGKKIHLWEIKITNSENKLVCVSRCTVAVIEKAINKA